jgi:glycerol-3-phosphate dehydrogenase
MRPTAWPGRRAVALDALRHAKPLLRGWQDDLAPRPLFAAPHAQIRGALHERLAGRHGAHTLALIAAAGKGELEPIAGTETLWAELRWAARAEAVERLEDLLLRRTRLGLQLRGGGAETMDRIRAICQAKLGWSDARWDSGQAAYLALWNTHYSLPPQQD